MGRPIKAGTADQSTVIRILDSTTFLPEEAVEHDTAGIALWYRREGATKTAISPAALAALDTAHADGGIEHIDDGYYRLDLPDAAVAAGAVGVAVGGTVTGMIIIGNYHTITAYDPYDSVRMGMTALPNAAADAAGGLPISDAGGLDLDAIKTETDKIAHADYGLAKLVRSTTPANTLSVNASNQVTVPDTQRVLLANSNDHGGNTAGITLDGAAGLSSGTGILANITGNLSGSIGTVSAAGITNASFHADVGTTAYVGNVIAIAAMKALDEYDPPTKAELDTAQGAVTLANGAHGGAGASITLADYSDFQGAAGDPWLTALPGAYGAGTAGKIVGDNLNATVGSRSSHSANDVRDAILTDATRFAGANIDAAVSSRSSHSVNNVRDAILADSTPFNGARIDAAISSRSSHTAANVVTALGTGATLTACLTATGFMLATEDGSSFVNIPDMATDINQGLILGDIAALNDVSVNDILDGTVEVGLTVAHALQLSAAVLAGMSAGGGTGTITFRDMANTKDRVTATVTVDGNRTVIVRDYD